MKLYLAEKPDQGRDIAKVLGVVQNHGNYIETKDGLVTWAIGHLYELVPPDHYDRKYAKWNLADLPIAPARFIVEAKDRTKSQLSVIKGLVKTATEVVIATDPDREGEAIAREILDDLRYRGPIKRLWLTGLDPESVQKCLNKLKKNEDTVGMYRASQGRSRADWMVGMNMTRAVTLRFGGYKEVLNIGRVQTPTFGLVVRREREIANFRPKDYFEASAEVRTESGQAVELTYSPGENDRIFNKAEVESIIARVEGSTHPLTVTKERKRTAPPKLFDLAGIQKHANKEWGWSADKTLDVMQALYEKHKYTSYPRTDCTFLPDEQRTDAPVILGNVAAVLGVSVPSQPEYRKTVFDTAKVTAHHAIIPTKQKANLSSLSRDEQLAYDAICRAYMGNFYPDYVYDASTISADTGEGIVFSVKGTVPVSAGWREVWGSEGKRVDLPNVTNGESGCFERVEVVAKQTKPPSHYTEGSLLEDMENVAKFVADPEHKKILKEGSGLGTPATRGAILKGLKDNGFLRLEKKNIRSTEKSQRLFGILEKNLPRLIDPCETAIWEDQLKTVEAGQMTVDTFMSGIEKNIRSSLVVLGGIEGESPRSSRPERQESEHTSFHPDHLGEPITEDDKAWYCPGYGRLAKVVSTRRMDFSEWKTLLEEGALPELKGFVSKAGKPFSAGLEYKGYDEKYKSPVLGFTFPDREQKAEGQTGNGSQMPAGNPTGIQTPFGELVDHAEFWTLSKGKGRIYKRQFGRDFEAAEIASVLKSGDKGVMFQFISTRSLKPYKATLKWDSNADPYPKMVMQLQERKEEKNTKYPKRKHW